MIIKIDAFSNGAHANQSTTPKVVPGGWAVIPDDIKIPETFPFVNIEVEGNTVTKMTAAEIPEEDAETATLLIPDPQADTDAMLIDHEYRLTLLELGICE